LGIEDIKTMHLKIIDSVKDKSKQITLAIYCMKQSYIVQNIALYDGVAKLYFNNWPQDYNENFSFCLFSNICHLSLADVYGIPKANFYLEKATKLEMWCCEFEEITAWNATKSGLKELRVSRCDSLKRLPPLGNTTSVEIEFYSINAIQFEVGRQTKFSFCGQSLTADTWQSMFAHPSFFRDIQKLSLSCDFSAEFQDFSCCRDIHVLELLNQVEGGHPQAFPILSSFNGRKLILKQFNLFSWNVVQENSFKKNIQDKSKQISLSFEDVDDSVMVKYSWSFEGVAKLSVRGGITCDGFSIFRTVRHLILYNVNTELKVNLHLESTTRLRVSFCSFTEITAWNSKTLQEVSINCCSSLKSCPPLDTIPVVSISFCCSTLCNALQFGRQTKFSCHFNTLEDSSLNNMFAQSIFYTSLQQLRLMGGFIVQFKDFSFCQNIPVLELNFSPGGQELPFIPVFRGKRIRLHNFSLSAWCGQVLPNIEQCHLYDCRNLFTFSEMPKLTRLQVFCFELQVIPNLPSLNYLSMESCKVKQIQLPLQMIKAEISNCEFLQDISGPGVPQSLTLHNCPRLKSLPARESIKHLTISYCKNLTTVEPKSDTESLVQKFMDLLKV
jgi:hypothetical protein